MATKNDKTGGTILNPNTGQSLPRQDIGSDAGAWLDGFKGLLGIGVDAYTTVATLKNTADIQKAEKLRDLQQSQYLNAMGSGAGNGVPQGSGSGSLAGINGIVQAGGGTGNLLMLAGVGLAVAYVISGRR